ncbi:hypothetical protein BGZ95_005031 [Linnemannia exigua]|uniref:Phosphatidylglycerol/phosphatidylinositol transfer protein n=1 Tax=Linnemannia exigua TaxID=604196 RepID=A0AAD4H8S7_9FUNG|nr:hypothetical protein BGZ95_005031 [Linnemannia exigua]
MKSISTIAILATVVFSTVSAQSGSYTNFVKCGGDYTALVTVDSAAFTPFPLCVGEKYCFEVHGTSSVPITQGAHMGETIAARGRLQPSGGQPDMCTLLAASGTPCPIPAGPVLLKFCYINKSMPENALIGWIFSAFTADNKNLFCLGAAVKTEPVEPTPENPNGIRGLFARNCTVAPQ